MKKISLQIRQKSKTNTFKFDVNGNFSQAAAKLWPQITEEYVVFKNIIKYTV